MDTKVHLTDLLADNRFGGIGVKMAAPETQGQQLEQDFSSLAFTFIRDRAPSLLPYLVGFETVDHEPDGSKAVGIFGFNINDKYYYTPVFFMNNQIKGMDLLYSVDDQIFYPLRESWIQHILDKQSVSLGKEVTEDQSTLRPQFESPNFQFLAQPPITGTGAKLAAATAGATDVWNGIRADIQARMGEEGDEEFKQAFAGAINTIEPVEGYKPGNSYLVEWLQKRGGVKMAQALGVWLQNVDFVKAAFEFYDLDDLLVTEFDEALLKKGQEAKIEVITSTYNNSPIEAANKKKIVRDGFTIIDRRPKEEKSEVYDTDYHARICNPDRPGEYDIFLSDGATAAGSVLYNCVSDQLTTVLFDTSKGAVGFRAAPSMIFTREPLGNEPRDMQTLFDRSKKLSSLDIDKEYVIFDKNGMSFGPFRVENITRRDGDLLGLRIYMCGGNLPEYKSRDTGFSDKPITNSYSDSTMDDWRYCSAMLTPVDREGTIRLVRNVSDSRKVVVPVQSYRVIELRDGGNNEVSSNLCPASLTDIDDALNKIAASYLQVDHAGAGEYNILYNDKVTSQQLNYKSAMVTLVGEYGVSVEDAETILKEAVADKHARKMIFRKEAQQVAMPGVMDQQMAADPQLGVMVQQPQYDLYEGSTQGLPEWQDAGPGSGININDMQPGSAPSDLAMQAAQTGQQSVFDHGAVGSLAETYDVDATIDSMLPDLMTAMDRLGRILFLFYWRNDDFAERYGTQDISELEDKLRSVFKNYGDLVLQLKQKSIEASNETYTEQ